MRKLTIWVLLILIMGSVFLAFGVKKKTVKKPVLSAAVIKDRAAAQKVFEQVNAGLREWYYGDFRHPYPEKISNLKSLISSQGVKFVMIIPEQKENICTFKKVPVIRIFNKKTFLSVIDEKLEFMKIPPPEQDLGTTSEPMQVISEWLDYMCRNDDKNLKRINISEWAWDITKSDILYKPNMTIYQKIKLIKENGSWKLMEIQLLDQSELSERG